jgi:hypothetical protein
MTEIERPWAAMVSGSRDMLWHHADLIEDKLKPFSGIRQSLVIHGAGEGRRAPIPGCDRVAADVASYLKFRVHGFPALWNLQDKSAGPIRNQLLLEILLAHGQAGYRMAFLAFSTGGPGTEGALRGVRSCSKSHEIQIEKIDVTL